MCPRPEDQGLALCACASRGLCGASAYAQVLLRSVALAKVNEPVADAPHGLQEVTGLTQLRSKARHVHVHGSRLDLGLGVPRCLKQLSPGLHPAPTLHEDLQQAVLQGRQVHLLSVCECPVRLTVQLHSRDAQRPGLGYGLRRTSSQESLDAQRQLARADQAELLADRGEDEVVLRFGHLVRVAAAEAAGADADLARLLEAPDTSGEAVARVIGHGEDNLEAAARGGRGQPAKPLRELGEHPDGGPVNVMDGRYGPYVTDGTVNATIPKNTDPESLTLDQAVELIAKREERMRAQGKDPRAKKKRAARKKKSSS